MTSPYKFELLKNKSYFDINDAHSVGISNSLLHYYVQQGTLRRLGRGIYTFAESKKFIVPFEFEDLVLASLNIPNSVICLISALAVFGLTEEIPRQSWLAVKHNARVSKRQHVKLVHMRDINLGKTKIKIGNVLVSIFDRERTIADCFRYLPKEIALKALKYYLASNDHKPNVAKLIKCFKAMRVSADKYIEVLTL